MMPIPGQLAFQSQRPVTVTGQTAVPGHTPGHTPLPSPMPGQRFLPGARPAIHNQMLSQRPVTGTVTAQMPVTGTVTGQMSLPGPGPVTGTGTVQTPVLGTVTVSDVQARSDVLTEACARYRDRSDSRDRSRARPGVPVRSQNWDQVLMSKTCLRCSRPLVLSSKLLQL